MTSQRVDLTIKRLNLRKEETRVLTLEVASWIAGLCKIEDPGELLLDVDSIQTGKTLYDLFAIVDVAHPLPRVHENAKPRTFPARENIKHFIDGGLAMGIPPVRTIEPEDIVARRNTRGIIYFLLSVARQAYILYGIVPPAVVRMELEIDELRKRKDQVKVEPVEPSIEHVTYVADENDEIDRWIAQYCNENQVPITATPTRVPGAVGEYVFAAEPEPHTVYYVRMVRGTPLVRMGDDWEELSALIDRKMKAAFVTAAKMIPEAPPIEEDIEEEVVVEVPSEPEESEDKEDTEDQGSLLAEAKGVDLSAIEKEQVMYLAGQDEQGRNILVVVGSRIPPISETRLYHLLLYFAVVLDKVAEQEYVIVYCHTKAHFSPAYFSWMRRARSRLPYKFRKNLGALHIVHPSFFIKATFAFFRPFISGKFWKKLSYYSSANTEKLSASISPLQVTEILPTFVLLASRKNEKFGPLFGGSLETALFRNPDDTAKVPRICYECIEFLRGCALQTEGLLRVPGLKDRMSELKDAFERDDDVRLWQERSTEQSHHNIAGVLKLYLRELEEPLIPFESYAKLIEIASADAAGNPDAVAARYREVIDSFTPLHKDTLQYVVEFLVQLISHCAKNKMNASNVSIVFSPNILRAKDETPQSMLADSKARSAVLRFLLEHPNLVFPTPLVVAPDTDERVRQQSVVGKKEP